jgi:8-oxo-dGTP pyrophosphatase MutT (NUDIX family)/phosphohistidine phosphatase SixA
MAAVVALARPSESSLLVSELVEAAGGVVLGGAPGERQILVIHRARHDDWSLPKGKLDDGEDNAAAALREVAEETGWRCEPGPWLPEVRYLDAGGRPKRVRFRVMRPLEQEGWAPSDEVDSVRWLPAAGAGLELSYPSDREVLEAALALDEPIHLIRHAKASSREAWEEDDDLRPLTAKGRRQAERARAYLGIDRLQRVLSSPAVRCVQTVEPMAKELGLGIEETDALREGTRADPVLRLLEGLAGPSAACTHGDVMFDVVESIARKHPIEGAIGWKKGSAWIIDRDGGDPVGARYVPPPMDLTE